MRWIRAICCAGLVGVASAASAQTSREDREYQAQTERLVEELQDLIRRAERNNAADPRFLDDLNALAGRYGSPRVADGRVVIRDDFRDGDFTSDPRWTVAAGDFWVDGTRLRTRVDTGRTTRDRGAPDTTAQALGTVLRGLLDQPAGVDAPSRLASEIGEIFIGRAFGNAFEIRMTLSALSSAGQLEFGPYQTAGRDIGYRLLLNAGGAPGVQLVRGVGRTSGIVDKVQGRVDLDQGRNHDIVWRRDEDGRMTVALDGERVIEATDRGIVNPFQGFTIVNHGGDYAITGVTVAEVEPAQASR